jgi:hypothetical protein
MSLLYTCRQFIPTEGHLANIFGNDEKDVNVHGQGRGIPDTCRRLFLKYRKKTRRYPDRKYSLLEFLPGIFHMIYYPQWLK